MTTDTHPRYGRTGCTCRMTDTGDRGYPCLDIDIDEDCPFHGAPAETLGLWRPYGVLSRGDARANLADLGL